MYKLFAVFFFSFLFFESPAFAQKSVFLFEQFTNAKIKMKPRGVTVAKANYDAGNKRLMYQDGKDMMELTNTLNVDTVYFGERKLIPASKGFYEVVKLENGSVLIDWYLRDVEIGKKGALGSTTSASVHPLQMSDFGNSTETYTAYKHQDGTENNVYRRRNDNSYIITVKNKIIKIKSFKQVLNAFQEHQQVIKEYIDKNNLEMRNVEDVLQLLNYCMGLSSM